VCKEGKESCRILISYETHQSLTQPGANLPSYMNYEIWLDLSASAVRNSTDKNVQRVDTNSNVKKSGRVFKIKLSAGTKTQFAEIDPLAQETLEAVQDKLPEIIDLCKKYGINYQFDEKTTKLLMGNS
jgi:hypothetical protein